MATKGPNLDLALRISADLGTAANEIAKLDVALDKVEVAGKSAAVGLDATTTAASRETRAVKDATTAVNAKTASNAKLKTSEDAVAKSTDRAAISAKQQVQAMRQLPMQITDIVTGLASGQNPFIVMIQQGGQLKDSFGGIAPAARALLGAVSPAFAAIAGGIAVVAGLAVALKQGQDELAEFERALIFTGNTAGMTADDLDALADRLDKSTEATSRHAAEALTLVTQTGQFTAEQIETIAAAALQMETATGQSLDETIGQFVKLKKDPVDAILALNDAQHFLTEETLAQIRTFKEQGREADASALAIRTFADTIDVRAPQATESLGMIEGVLHNIKKAGAEAWDSVVQGMQDADRQAAESVQMLGGFLNRMRAGGPGGMWAASMGLNAPIAIPMAPPGKSTTVDTDAEKARQSALAAWDRLALSNLDKRARLEREITDIRKAGLAAGKNEAEIQQQIAEAQARYQEGLPKGPKASKGPKSEAEKDNDAAKRELGNLQKQIALLGSLEEGETKATHAARIRVEVEQGAFRHSDRA